MTSRTLSYSTQYFNLVDDSTYQHTLFPIFLFFFLFFSCSSLGYHTLALLAHSSLLLFPHGHTLFRGWQQLGFQPVWDRVLEQISQSSYL